MPSSSSTSTTSHSWASFLLLIRSSPSPIPVHAHLLKLGLLPHPHLRNALLHSHAQLGLLHLARRLFDELSHWALPDSNSLLSAYFKWGHLREARALFDATPRRNVVTWTTMVTGYARIGDLESARRCFDAMPDRTVVSWNAMLSGYSQNGFEDEALRLFHEMVGAGFQPNETTWVTVISSCAARGDPSLADSLAALLHQVRGIDFNCFLKTALLDMYAKCGRLAAARRIFDDLAPHNNTVAWNAMVSAFMRSGDLASARELFDRMLNKDVVSWNSMIAGYAQNGQSAFAVRLFKDMVTLTGEHPKPDEVTMASVFSACGHLGTLEIGKWAVAFLEKNQIRLGTSGYNSLIFMYSKCGSIEDAQRIFQEMQRKDVVSYNTLISGLAAHGRGREALEVMSKMKEEGIDPDRVTYVSILTACSHGGLLQEGRRLFETIKAPSNDHYACMVDLLGRAGELEEAKRLIQIIPMKPHAGVYGSLLNACRIHRRTDLAEMAAYGLFEIEPNNSGNYVLLSNIYAQAGRWEDVDKVRQMMRRRGVKKATGWSWVEHKGEVHKFLAGDRSHERCSEIYHLLANLRRRMQRAGYVAEGSCVLRDVVEEDREEMVVVHSEKLAVCFALIVSEAGEAIRVMKNMRVCWDCHTAIKTISKLEGREIIVRDNNRFHHFLEGQCSCKDYW
ncbi:pentatricopeptide repeat-containing protein At1g14470-like [Rhodamnia argentea]|uniref:Pentatricopeptide repeat-containing protein At1g14470-like n=1 Tax=Rhodamnia argentea TaxID=178133 RepID=A0A8B8PX59_9MYRT|nr:pentatricopeptide repeat-containing protein At1g14470-like [Rhodamnia argentea]